MSAQLVRHAQLRTVPTSAQSLNSWTIDKTSNKGWRDRIGGATLSPGSYDTPSLSNTSEIAVPSIRQCDYAHTGIKVAFSVKSTFGSRAEWYLVFVHKSLLHTWIFTQPGPRFSCVRWYEPRKSLEPRTGRGYERKRSMRKISKRKITPRQIEYHYTTLGIESHYHLKKR